MRTLSHLFESNRKWAEALRASQPEFFEQLSRQQTPEYLWIGCSDSRVPANQIVGMLPGQIFVHRNVANQVVHTDFNCLSVIQYAVDVLQVKHVIVCGHYGCGGVQAVLKGRRVGLVDNWLQHVRDVWCKHAAELVGMEEAAQFDRLCELNVRAQVASVAEPTIVQDAWARGASLSVHGWIYSLRDGLLRDMDVTVNNRQEAVAVFGRDAFGPGGDVAGEGCA